MYAAQIEMVTTGHRIAGVLAVMEVILVTRGIWVIAEIVEIVVNVIKGSTRA